MYNSQKFIWVHLLPGTERFGVDAGRFGNFQASSLTPEEYAIFLSTMATVASNGVKVRTLYVWESGADRHVYIYTESGRVIASYPPPEGYDPYELSRRQLGGETALDQEQGEELINSLDPSRVILRAEVAEGPVPIAPPMLQPDGLAKAPLPGGFGILAFDPQGPEPLSRALATWLEKTAPLGLTLKFENPGKGSYIPIWRRSGPEFAAGYTFWTQLENVASDSAQKYHEESLGLRSWYYYSPFLDTTYIQAPGGDSVTVKYVADRDVTHIARLWRPGDWEGAASLTAGKTSLGSGVYVYGATFVDTDFPGWKPEEPDVGGVRPDTTYKYVFEWEEGVSDEHTAVGTTRTWPEQEDVTEFSFIVYGDNRWDDSSATFNHRHRDVACLGILRGGCIFQGGVKVDDETVYVSDYPPFILHTGDLVNAGGDPLQWIPHFFRPAGALLGRVPVFPCVGNHEISGDSAASKYTALFNLPSANERWYSFDYGRCHFICLDAYSDFSGASDQYGWLIKGGGQDAGDLPQAWRGKTVYGTVDRIFVYLHFPPYSSGPHGTKKQSDDPAEYQKRMDLRAYLVPKFEKYRVDMVFAGHEHLYEMVSKGGIQYVVTGGGGAPGHSINLGWNYDATPGAVRQAWYDQNRTDKGDWHHYCHVKVSADAAVAVEVWNDEHNLLDSLQIP
jgi:hypothetical protein